MRRSETESPALRHTALISQAKLIDPPVHATVEALESAISAAQTSNDMHVLTAWSLLPCTSTFVLSRNLAIIRPLIHLYLNTSHIDMNFQVALDEIGIQLMILYDEFSDVERIELLGFLPKLVSLERLIPFCSERLQYHEELSYGETLALLEMFACMVDVEMLIQAMRSDDDGSDLIRDLFHGLYMRFEDECDEDDDVPGHLEWLRNLERRAWGGEHAGPGDPE